MVKNVILRRVIAEEDCPGTCCKSPARPPFPLGDHKDCRYLMPDFNGRPHGGCMLFDKTQREALLGEDDVKQWQDVCVALPWVELNVPLGRSNKFTRRGGTKWCDCFVEEECDGD